MDNQPLKLEIDSKQARADLDALAKALDSTGAAVNKMKGSFATGMAGVSASLNTSMASMEKFAQVANLIGKVKLSSDPAMHVREFANALNALGRAKSFDAAQIASIKSLSTTLKTLQVPNQAQRLTQFLNAVGSAKAPSQGAVQRINELLKVLQNFKAGGATRNTESLSRFFATLASMKVPSEAAIARLEQMFRALGSAKGVPNAQKIAQELDLVAAAANRASIAMNAMPRSLRGSAPAFAAVEKGAGSLHSELAKTPGHAERANKAFGLASGGLLTLGERFKVSYQLGTVFSAMFSAFTVGQFIKGIYEANVGLLKLQKAMLFQTDSMEGAEKATDRFIAINDKLGLSLKDSMESYGRFSISAKASGLNIKQTEDIYKSIGTALQVVGADSHQASLAFFALTEMLQKGNVHSKEFNRQLGQQIPGNAVLGAQALSHLLGKYVSVAEFFQKMQKNQIDAATFVPEYAKTVSAMYSPLQGLITMRPDTAFNSLKTAFMLFAREVGHAGFITALTKSLQELHDKLIYVDKDGVEHLQPAVQKLATTFGHDLAGLVHGAAEAMGFLATHLEGVIASMKAMLALKVGATFLSWGAGAYGFAASLIPVAKGEEAVAAATAATAAAGGARTAAGVGGAAAELTLGRRRGLGRLFGGRVSPLTAAAVGSGGFRNFGSYGSTIAEGGSGVALAEEIARNDSRDMFSARGIVAQQKVASLRGGMAGPMGAIAEGGAISGSAGAVFQSTKAAGGAEKAGFLATLFAMKPAGKAAAEGVEVAEKGAVKAASTMEKFGGVLGKVGPLLGMGLVGALAAGAIALVAFSNQQTTVNGKTMTFGNIVTGGFEVAGKKIADWWQNTSSHLGSFGTMLNSLGKNAGNITAAMVTGFIVVGQVIGDVVIALGKSIYDLLAGPFVKLFSVMKKLLSGDIGGAGNEIKEYVMGGGALGAVVGDLTHGVLQSGRDIGAAGQTYRDVANAGAAQAATVDTDVKQSKVYADAVEQLAASDKQRTDEQTRGEIEQLNRRMAMGESGLPKVADILSDLNKTAESQAAAAKATASAATDTANAATKAAGAANGVGANGKPIPAAPAAIQAAIAQAAKDKGIDAGYLTRIAFQESSFNATARPRDRNGNLVGSARGLFQINKGTADQLGADYNQLDDPLYAAEQAAKLTKINGAILQGRLGREATGGELYGAHFLGAAGAARLIQSADDTPNAIAADKYADAAKANPSIFYADSKNRKNPYTLKQVLDHLNQVGGGNGGLTGKMLSPATEDDEGSFGEKVDTLRSQYKRLVSGHNPSESGDAMYQEFVSNLDKIAAEQKKLQAKNPTWVGFISADEVLKEEARIKRLADDIKNPFSKDIRLGDAANSIVEMRLKGMQDEADFQVKLNQLAEEGYDISKLDTKEQRDAVIALKDRTDALKAQVALVAARNQASVQSIGRNGSANDIAFANLVKPKEGETFAHAVAGMAPGELAATRAEAQTNVATRTAESASNIAGSLQEQATAARLDPVARAMRADYKSYLEELTGVTDASLDRLEKRTADSPGLQALAKRAAEIKQQIENPPGFQKWAEGLEPLQKRLEDIKGQFAEGLSQGITDALYGEKVDWKGALTNISKQITKAYVDTAIGGLITKVTGKSGMTPEQQATIDAANAASKAAEVQATTAESASTELCKSATDLTSAASALSASAQAITSAVNGAGQAAAAGGAGGAGVTSSGGLRGAVGGGNSGAGPSQDDIDNAFMSLDNGDPRAAANLGMIDPAAYASANGQTSSYGELSALPDLLTSGGDSVVPADIATNVDGLVNTPSMLADAAGAMSGGGGIGGMLGKMGGSAMGLLGLLGPLLMHKKTKTPPNYPAINGVIGEARPVNVTGTEVAAHGNPIAALLNMGLSAFTGGFGAGGGASLGKTLGLMGSSMSKNTGSILGALGGAGSSMSGGLGSIMSFLGGMFSEGGYSTQPVSTGAMSMSSYHNAPAYAEGTPNTSGGMPAILHPNEAVIPLSRGRKIPVDLGEAQMGQQTVVNSHITVIAPNPDGFRAAQGSIQRKTNRDMKRAAVRNLSPH